MGKKKKKTSLEGMTSVIRNVVDEFEDSEHGRADLTCGERLPLDHESLL